MTESDLNQRIDYMYDKLEIIEKEYKNCIGDKSESCIKKNLPKIVLAFFLLVAIIAFITCGIEKFSLPVFVIYLVVTIVMIFYFYIFGTVYRKKNERQCLKSFAERMSKLNLDKTLLDAYILYYENLAVQKNKTLQSNLILSYISVVFIPVLLNIIDTGKNKGYSISLCILAGIIVPVIIVSISTFINRKNNMYEDIVYFLKMYKVFTLEE